jgi:hypothetical protein
LTTAGDNSNEKGEDNSTRVMGCLLVRPAVKLLIFTTILGLFYSIFCVIRASILLHEAINTGSIFMFVVTVVGQLFAFMFDIFFLQVAVPFVRQRGRHNDEDRDKLVNSITYLILRDFFTHISVAIGFGLYGLVWPYGDMNKKWGLANLLGAQSGFTGAIPLLCWVREGLKQHAKANNDYFAETRKANYFLYYKYGAGETKQSADFKPDQEEQPDNSSRNLIDKSERAGAEVELTPVPAGSEKQEAAAANVEEDKDKEDDGGDKQPASAEIKANAAAADAAE